MEPAAKRRRHRKRCEHCEEELSYSAYLRHRRLYYVAATETWIKKTNADSDSATPQAGCAPVEEVEVDACEDYSKFRLDVKYYIFNSI